MGLTTLYCTGDCQAWYIVEFPYLNQWQIYLRHTPQTAAQDLRVSWSTGEVFRLCQFKELTQHTSRQQLWPQLSQRSQNTWFYWDKENVICKRSYLIRLEWRQVKDKWREVTAAIENKGRKNKEKLGKVGDTSPSPEHPSVFQGAHSSVHSPVKKKKLYRPNTCLFGLSLYTRLCLI